MQMCEELPARWPQQPHCISFALHQLLPVTVACNVLIDVKRKSPWGGPPPHTRMKLRLTVLKSDQHVCAHMGWQQRTEKPALGCCFGSLIVNLQEGFEALPLETCPTSLSMLCAAHCEPRRQFSAPKHYVQMRRFVTERVMQRCRDDRLRPPRYATAPESRTVACGPED